MRYLPTIKDIPTPYIPQKVFNLTNATSWGQFTWMAKGVRTADGETPASTSNLVTQWSFNETSGTTAVSGGVVEQVVMGRLPI